MHPACDHKTASLVFNALSVPVRLICPCGEEWRVVPIDALVTLPVYASGPRDAFKGPVKKPRCRQGHLLADCGCSTGTGDRR